MDELGGTIERIMYVSMVQGKLDVVRCASRDVIRFTARMGVEGVDWIRGNHDPDSEEVKALLVAYAISVNG